MDNKLGIIRYFTKKKKKKAWTNSWQYPSLLTMEKQDNTKGKQQLNLLRQRSGQHLGVTSLGRPQGH